MRNANVYYGTSMQGVDKWQDVADDDPSVWEAWNDQHLQPRCSIYGKIESTWLGDSWGFGVDKYSMHWEYGHFCGVFLWIRESTACQW